jgi:hypothetical protein
MTALTPAEVAGVFAAMLDVPYDPATDPDVSMLGLIETAQRNGITWAQIGTITIGRRDPKAAKAHAKTLAVNVRRRAFAAMPAEVDGA